jgi:transcriptional regulator with XRE-family HTH domain
MKPDDEQSTTGREVERILLHLQHAIRDQGFTQLQVQEALGWGRSYISQLPTRQKSVRLDQVLSILGVIGVDPGGVGLHHNRPSA